MPGEASALHLQPANVVVFVGTRELVLTYDRSKIGAGRLLNALTERGLAVEDVSTREADLEDVFLHLTQAGALPDKANG